MAQVIEFPMQVPNGWPQFEQALREMLSKRPGAQDWLEELVRRMRIAFEEHVFEYQFKQPTPTDINGLWAREFEVLTQRLQQRTTHLLLRRLELELERVLAPCRHQ